MTSPHAHTAPKTPNTKTLRARAREFLGVFQYSRRALELVWGTSRSLTLLMAALTLLGGILPAGVAYVGKWIVDAVVAASNNPTDAHIETVVTYVLIELALVATIGAVQKGLSVVESLFRAMLGHKVNVIILEKALTLSLAQFEDADFYDKLTRARREASRRPLALVRKTFAVLQNTISLATYGGLLLGFSGWAVLVLLGAGLPAFIAETYFSGEAFRIFRWRSPETRKQIYLETLIAREDYAKEVQLFSLGPTLLQRYKDIFQALFAEDRALTLKRGGWGYLLSLLTTGAFYAAYAWIALSAARGTITLGDMTMYLLVFKQGQSAFASILTSIGGMYEDNLYLSNLYEYLEQPSPSSKGDALQGPSPDDGLRFEDVSFTYPDSKRPALKHINLHIPPGAKLALVGENGSGKTTLIKLLTRLYSPTKGRITLDGLDLQKWDEKALRARIGVIFQDFVRLQFKVGENIGVGDVDHIDDEDKQRRAAELGMADDFIQRMNHGYDTQLGKWFKGGQELSGGQWQKIALSRLFMRQDADILILDEPTSAMDPEAEARIFEHFRSSTQGQMTILISHRFSTVRIADQIVVLDQGALLEQGSHETLMDLEGHYAHLFTLQAEGYQ